MGVSTFATGIDRGTALCVLPDGTVVVASGDGDLTRYDTTGTPIDSAAIAAAVTGLAAHPAGDGVLAAADGQGLYEVRFGPTAATNEMARLTTISGVAVDVASGSALLTATGPGRLVRVRLDGSGKKFIVSSDLDEPRAVLTRAGSPHAYALSSSAPATLQRTVLSGGSVDTLIADLGAAHDLAWTDVAGTSMAVATADGTIMLLDIADPAAPATTLVDGLDPIWGVALAEPAVLVAGAGQEVLRVDLPPAPDVVLEMPTEAMYLSSWAMIGIATTTIDPADLFFRVEPPTGGLVSHSRDATFADRPAVLLAVSAIPGEYKLIAHDVNTGDEVAAGRFVITDAWSGVDGPPANYVGSVGIDVPDPAWGGGDPFVPQNLSVTPVLGNKNVAVVIAETSDSTALSASDQATLRDAWQDEVFDGVVRGGVTESAGIYWNDVSAGRMDLINAGVVGPIRLPNNWASYATDVDTSTGQTDGWEGFGRAVVADLVAQNDAAAAAGNPPVLDLMTVDSIVLVLRSLPASGTNPGRFVWPSATRPGSYQITFETGRQVISVPTPFGSFDLTLPIFRTIQMFAMPDDWETREGSARVRGETVAHELGHNFGLPDEYARGGHPQWAKDRDLDAGQSAGTTWSLMSWEQNFAQPTVVEKMMLGWVDAGHVRNLSFATLGPVDEDIVLHASDLGAPPAGRHSVTEVRIADGRNYYFEYRRERPNDPNDQDLPTDRTVVGVDCVSGMEPADRRNILRLRDDSDADKGEFQVGDDYEERDTSAAAYPNDFLMEVTETQADFARIHITYGDAKPDPQIRPWAPSTNWKSPDLRVTNARNAADSRFRDIPWEGHDNRIVATVRNPGQIDATNVRVDFFIKDFTLGGGAETALGSDTHDVPSGAQVEFTSSVPWIPFPVSAVPFLNIAQHYCVVARIAEYVDPANPAIREITLDNNEAQSNHTQLISVSASPASRETGLVKVNNPLDVPAVCRVQVRQTSPFVRTYLDHAWVRLQPGEERNVRFLTESIVGDPALAGFVKEHSRRIYKEPSSLRLTGIAQEPHTCDGYVTGGAQVLVRAARATRFVKISVQGELATGRIETVDDGSGVDGIVLITIAPPDRPDRQWVEQGRVVNGNFEFILDRPAPSGYRATGHYTGGFDRAPCDSETLRIR
jgi:hypothetical protein